MANPVAEALTPFFWGRGGARMTPEQIAREREIAEALGGVDTSPVGHWLEGAARMANAAVGRIREGRANRAADENATFNRETVAGLLGGLGGGSMASTSPVAAALTGSTPMDPSSARVAAAHSASAAPGQFSGSQQEFVDMLLPAAMEASQRTGIDPRIIVAQAAQETGWGRSAPGNNFFGIKSHGQGGGQTLKTHEYVNGKRVNVSDSFRTFADPSDSVRGYADFILNNPRYKPFMQADGLDAQLEALQASGYATDPNYSRSVGSIARGIALPEQPSQAALESLAVGESMPMPAAAPAQAPAQVAQAGGINPAIIEALSSPYADEGTKRIAGLLLGQHLEQQQAAQQTAIEREQRLAAAQAAGVDPRFIGDDEIWKQAAGAQFREQPTDVREYEYARGQGYQGTFADFQREMKRAGAMNVDARNIGAIPQGYRMIYDEAGNPVQMEPIAGGPADTRAQDEAKGEQSQTWNSIVNQEIGRALDIINSSGLPTTGAVGDLLSGVGGTGARDLRGLLDTIKSNAGFDRLQAMRDASPTGGALGQVSERELAFLQSTIGNLEQSQSREQLEFNLKRLQKLYQNMLEGRRAYDGLMDERQSARPLTEMTDEELEAIINGDR